MSSADTRCLPLPLSVALFAGDVTPALIVTLCDGTLVEAKRSVDTWIACGILAQSESRKGHPRVRTAARDAALATSTPRQRRRAYEAIARALDEPDATESELLEIARHYRDGAQYRLAIARYLDVAERRLERGERQAAHAVLDEVASSVAARGPEMLAVLDLQARCAMASGNVGGALTILERLRRSAGVCGDRSATIRALLGCAECSVASDAPAAAIGYAMRAIELCGSLASSSLEYATATLTLAEAICLEGRTAQAAERWQEAARLGAAREPALITRFHYVAGALCTAQRDPVGAVKNFRAASIAATVELDVAWKLKAERALAGAQLQSADLASAASTLRSALAVAIAEQHTPMLTRLSHDLADALFEAGRYGEALRAIPTVAPAGNDAVVLRLALHLNDADLIERSSALDVLEDAFASRSPQRIAAAVPVFAAYERRRSDPAAAQALYRRAIEVLRSIECTAPAEFWCDAALYCADSEIGPVRSALSRADRDAPPLATLMVALGTLALNARENVDGAGLAARAEALATALLTAGFKTRARVARAIAAKATPAGRAADVISLIGSGCSNSEIAARLYVSKRTIEKTIGELLKSNGVRSRWQLIALTGRLDHSDSASSNERLRSAPQR